MEFNMGVDSKYKESVKNGICVVESLEIEISKCSVIDLFFLREKG
jgi:hypothetical protein